MARRFNPGGPPRRDTEFQPVLSLVHLLEMDDETQSIH
jgi:hypothetical protein